MAEERSHKVGEFLQSAQRPQDPLLQLCLGLRHFLGDLLFDVTSHQFIRIQLGRVRRQEPQFQPAALLLDELAHQPRAVRRMAVNDQEHRGALADHQATQKLELPPSCGQFRV